MFEQHITDWNNAYANGINIPGGDRWPTAWVQPAASFREAQLASGRAKLDLAYGAKPRQQFDLFLPEGKPLGLVVFVHGGFWLALDKSFWSHLASGPLAHGYAVVMPSYTLAPESRIAGITAEIGMAITVAAELVDGPIIVSGHSAGGHLASRMISATTPLSPQVLERIRHVVSISGLHDLRPLMGAEAYRILRIDEAEALAESPALLRPRKNARITCWVGSAERPEFVRQSALLANIWTGLGARTRNIVEPDRHHFNILDGLTDPQHPLTLTLLEA